jgi:hypothetical protein
MTNKLIIQAMRKPRDARAQQVRKLSRGVRGGSVQAGMFPKIFSLTQVLDRMPLPSRMAPYAVHTQPHASCARTADWKIKRTKSSYRGGLGPCGSQEIDWRPGR